MKCQRGNRRDSGVEQPFQQMKATSLFTCVLIGALIFVACSRQAPPAPPPPEVLVTEAATRDVPVYREWVGTIEGSETADIRARINGHLFKRNYAEGSFVKKGDLLFEIDPRPYEAALAQAKSELDEGKAAALATAADRVRYDKLFAEKVISSQEHMNRTQISEGRAAKVKALEAALVDAELNLNFCKVT